MLLAEIAELREKLVAKQYQNEVYRKLLFGLRSEKRPFDIPGQGTLFEGSATQSDVDEPKQKVEYERGKAKKSRPEGCVNSEGLRFNDGVPVKTIHLSPNGIEGLSADEYEIIGTREFANSPRHRPVTRSFDTNTHCCLTLLNSYTLISRSSATGCNTAMHIDWSKQLTEASLIGQRYSRR